MEHRLGTASQNKFKNRRNLIYLLSLLIHLIFFILFLLYCFKPHPPINLPKKEETEIFIFEESLSKEEKPEKITQPESKKEEEIPALRAQDTNLGFLDGQEKVDLGTTNEIVDNHTPNIPKDEISQEEQISEKTAMLTEQIATENPIEKESIQEIPEPEKKETPAEHITQKQEKEPQSQEQANEEVNPHDNPTTEIEAETFLDDRRIERLKKVYAQKSKQIKARKKRIKEVIAYDKQVKAQVERIRAQEAAGSDIQAPKIKSNILARTKGFIESWAEPGNDAFSCSGLNKPITGFEDYKEQYYDALVFWKAQKIWYSHRIYEQFTQPYKATIVIEGNIDKNGNLITFQVLKSTGRKDIDQAVEESFRKASPFNPLPKHLNQEVHCYAGAILIDLTNQKVAWK